MNLMDGILQQRDRLQELKNLIGTDLELPNFFFYKAQLNNLIDKAGDAIGGRLDIIEMLILFKAMKEFE